MCRTSSEGGRAGGFGDVLCCENVVMASVCVIGWAWCIGLGSGSHYVYFFNFFLGREGGERVF